ncbi:MAG: WbqC family protein [Alphaproteobacteria bacterium]|nr:WbqC family protein [Alphaproteobacteria bacterium]
MSAAEQSRAAPAPRTLAIMQPTFLPWVGYFALIDRVDRFVLLDDVQFDKRSWQQRNRIKTANGPLWLTVPVLTKGRRDQTILEAEVQPDARFAETALKTLEHAYAKAAYFAPVMDRIAPAFEAGEEGLCALNIALIEALCDLTGLQADLVRSSATPVPSTKAQRLADLCTVHGARRYLSPPGSKDYLDGDPALGEAGVELAYFNYTHPVWPQLHGAFEPYMCTLDLVMNALPDSLEIIRSGVGEDSAG